VATILAIGMMGFQLSPSRAEVIGARARGLIDSSIALLRGSRTSLGVTGLNSSSQRADTPGQRALQITHFRLCPRRLSLFVGENYTLVPIALDQNREVVHGVAYEWQSSNAGVASVSGGTVDAVAPGLAVVTVRIGTARATVVIGVSAGTRGRLPDAAWDPEHTHDCDDPEDVAVTEADQNIAKASQSRIEHQIESETEPIEGRSDLAHRVKAAMMRRGTAKTHVAPNDANPKLVALQGGTGTIDGDGGDPIVSQATASFANAIGSPRFSAQEAPMGSATKTKNNLASYDYSFAAPVVGLPGRGIGLNLAMIYNSRVWSLDNGQMIFNYNKGWPAAGWSLGYGRLIDNYDGAGNWLLLGPDGTRIHLQTQIDGTLKSTDGSFITLNPTNGKLRYPEGTLLDFDVINNRWLPTMVRTANGQQITIAYKTYVKNSSDPNYFPVRWAIDSIQDTVGRYIHFNYDPTTHYLTSITAPDQGGGTRTLVQISYQTITLRYNFSTGLAVNTPASGSLLDVVKRIYYPQTGRGYLFPDYNSYAMARKVSMQIGMSASSDGTTVAYTSYNYVDVSTQVGALNDAPQYTTRSEWWQDKTDNNGNATTAATDYTYSRSTGTDANGFPTEIDTVQNNDSNLKVITTTGNGSIDAPDSFGHVISSEYKDLSNSSLQKTSYSYAAGPDGGTQLVTVTSVVDGGQQTKTTYSYGTFGRVATADEYGFSTSIQRRTSYSYLNGPYVDNNLLQLVKNVTIYDGSNLTTPVAKTDFTYDDYASTGGILSPTPLPPNHDPNFNSMWTIRGNVTAVTMWVNPVSGPSITRYAKYDIFGNVIRADVSCCNSRSSSFSDAATHYSEPDSVTDGTPNVVPFLTTNFVYDLNTGLVLSVTDPQNRTTSFHYDNAWRLDTMTPPQNAFSTTTQFDKDANGNDLLAYAQKVGYTDADGILKTITSKSWFDGAGRVIRAGTGQGSTPANFDTVKALYDPVGRLLKQSNPYLGDASGNGSPAYWTMNNYDPLSRMKVVTLPDLQTIQTTYNSAIVTVTDQVGRKRQSQADGLGRVISITEQDPSTAALSLITTYSYDTLDNLKGVNQGGQTRSFVYDALSRMTSQNTPEGGPVGFTYTDFGAVATRTDPRGVITTYGYDVLNRLTAVSYNTTNAAGVSATTGVTISYRTSFPGNGEVESVTDGAGTRSYVFDSLGRTTSKTRAIDGNSYQTQYQYNAINQLSVIAYPSNKQVRRNHDMRGRLSGIDKLSGGLFVSSYVSGVAYNTAGQLTGLTDGSGVAESYTYSNDRLQLTRQTVVKGATTLMDLNYSYTGTAGASGAGTTVGNSGQLMAIINNPNAQPSTINTKNRNQAFTYDNVGRLVTATGTGSTLAAWQRRFAYDRWGNRTGIWDAAVGGNQIQSVVLQQQQGAPPGVPSNRMSSVTNDGATSTCVYDAAGNLTSDGLHTYQYDAEGRITNVDAAGATYTYDFANRRVKKAVGTGASADTTYYIWEGAQVIAEYSNARADVGGTSYYLTDRLSTRMITDATGVVKGTRDHLPFGEESGTTGTNDRHCFTSYERDTESGTDYAINRQHQYANGRFTQPDPVDGDTDFPQTLNRYSYTMNDPINLWDPLGLEFGGQNQGTCPAEFHTCVDVIVPGIGRVLVGLDGLGGGTFIWGSSNLTDSLWGRFKELTGGLPTSFSLNPSFGQFLDNNEPGFLMGVRNQIYKRFLKELLECDNKASRELGSYLSKLGIDVNYYKSKQTVEGLGSLLGILGVPTGIQGLVDVFKNPASLGPSIKGLGAVGSTISFLELNANLNEMPRDYMDGFTRQAYDKAGQQFKNQARACRKKVRKNYGF
jgi:RHS repeat-associated protein